MGFMDFDNQLKTIMYYLLIERMICLGYQDGFLMVSATVCTVIYWTWLTMNHDTRYWVAMIHQTTMLHVLSTLREY